MPLDNTNYVTETKPDLSKPSLEGLSWLLRHLPADHEWDFSDIVGRIKEIKRDGGCLILESGWNMNLDINYGLIWCADEPASHWVE